MPKQKHNKKAKMMKASRTSDTKLGATPKEREKKNIYTNETNNRHKFIFYANQKVYNFMANLTKG